MHRETVDENDISEVVQWLQVFLLISTKLAKELNNLDKNISGKLLDEEAVKKL